MQVRWITAFLDFPAAQFGAEVTFWRAISGSTVSPPRGPHREFATLEPFSGDAHLRVQRVGSGPGGVHVDLHVDDRYAAALEASALGAGDAVDHGTHLTTTSPGGLPICFVGFDGPLRRSRPIRWPEDTISIIDQVCLDIPAALFARERAFWPALTGLSEEPTNNSELVALHHDQQHTIRLLLRRLQPHDPRRHTTAHLDIATTSVDDEIARHQDWGATVLERLDGAAMMADPAGRRYCITSRHPRSGR
ncbi:MAG: VOC family protein [Gordonia sp. (in: high G+C Gram-positive bacteria)]